MGSFKEFFIMGNLMDKVSGSNQMEIFILDNF
jgi:hypothetical protein